MLNFLHLLKLKKSLTQKQRLGRGLAKPGCLKKNTPPLSVTKKFFDHPGHLFGVTSSGRFLAAASHLGMYLNVAVMAQRTQVFRVIHEPVFLGVVYSILHRLAVVYFGRRVYVALGLAPLAKWVRCQRVAPQT